MLHAVILVCSLGGLCDATTATSRMIVPDSFANPVTCLMQGEAYLAQTALGRDLADSQVRVICERATATALRTRTIRLLAGGNPPPPAGDRH